MRQPGGPFVRGLCLITCCVCVVLASSGCGGSAHPVQLTPGSDSSEVATETQATTSEPRPNTSLPEAGTITVSGNGTTVDEQFLLGSLGEGSAAAPPTDVLESCNSSYTNPSIIDASAFVEGTLTVSYTKGVEPIEVKLVNLENNLSSPEGGAGIPDKMAVYVNHEWQCNEEQPPTVTIAPGDSEPLSFWLIFPDDLTNERPHLSQTELNRLTLASPLSISEITTTPRETFSGPRAADCEGTDYLLPFAHLPFTVARPPNSPNGEGKITCQHKQ